MSTKLLSLAVIPVAALTVVAAPVVRADPLVPEECDPTSGFFNRFQCYRDTVQDAAPDSVAHWPVCNPGFSYPGVYNPRKCAIWKDKQSQGLPF
jgi:hypothetical protein